VLDLIERWQRAESADLAGSISGRAELNRVARELLDLSVPPLRQLAEQHAAQLRLIECCSDTGIHPAAAAAADFLATPRREPEAE